MLPTRVGNVFGLQPLAWSRRLAVRSQGTAPKYAWRSIFSAALTNIRIISGMASKLPAIISSIIPFGAQVNRLRWYNRVGKSLRSSCLVLILLRILNGLLPRQFYRNCFTLTGTTSDVVCRSLLLALILLCSLYRVLSNPGQTKPGLIFFP